MSDPGYFLDPANWPLFMQSAMAEQPGAAGPMTRALPGYEQMSPFELAALRQRESVRPTAGRAGEGPTVPGVLMSAVAPEAMALRAATYAPKTLAAALGLTALATPTDAGEATDFKWSDPNTDRTKRLNEIEQEIKLETSRKTPSAPGTQAKRVDSLNAEKTKLLDARGAEYNDAFSRWQAAETARTQAERPFREEYPNAYRMLPLAGWATSALGGALGAKGGAPVRSMVGGALGAIPGSMAAAVGPTAYDAATLPTGSKYQQQAVDWLQDPKYWQGRVAPEVLTGMGIGATTGKLASQVMPGPRSAPQAPAMLPSAAQFQALPAPPAASAPPVPYFDKASNMWRDRTTGRFTAPPPPGKAPALGLE